MSGAEIMILLVVGIVVVGPKKLPGMMRTAGQWVAKVRRMTSNVRENTGIDRIIREEGLEKEIRELQSLARSPVIQSLLKASPAGIVGQALSNAAAAASAPVTSPARPTPTAPVSDRAGASPAPASAAGIDVPAIGAASTAQSLIRPAEGTVRRGSDQAMAVLSAQGFFSFREREYPTMGCDSYDALPDDLDDPDAYPDEDPEAFGPPADEAADGAGEGDGGAPSDEVTPAGAATEGGAAIDASSTSDEPSSAVPDFVPPKATHGEAAARPIEKDEPSP